MSVKQISVFLENKKGRLLAVAESISQKNVNIRALSVADTSDFGILRMIVDQPDLALEILREDGFTVSMNDVIAVEMSDAPGGLYAILQAMEETDVNVEYAYAFCDSKPGRAIVIFRVEKQDHATEVLLSRGIQVLEGDTLYNL